MEGEVAGEESPNAQSHLSVTGEKSRRSRTRLEDATEGGEGSWWRWRTRPGDGRELKTWTVGHVFISREVHINAARTLQYV